MLDELQIQEFMSLFSGSKHNYGEYIYTENKKNGKLEGQASTVKNKLITIHEYRAHLEGIKGLGIIPINENQKCVFCVLDVDVYDRDLTMYIEAIERGNFPLVPFMSKSGGLHIYLFFKQEVSARIAIDAMRKFSVMLAIDLLVKTNKNKSIEIFPKQIKLQDKEVGNWINLPYYNHEHTRQCAIREGKHLTLTDALVYIRNKQSTMTEVNYFFKECAFSDAPPCLQTLYFLNPFDHNTGRNNFLFSFGVYLKKKDEEFFEQSLSEVNENIKSPLPGNELEQTVLKSLRKRDYMYKCKEDPCVDYCQKTECGRREFGIGKSDGYFSSVECGQLYQYRTHQPYYEWDVRLQGQELFKRLRFTSEDEIIRQDTFLKLCMRELHEIPSKLKQGEWFNKVNQALKELRIIAVDAEDDTSPLILFKNLFVDFLTGRARAETKDQILAKRVFFDDEQERYVFRVKDLIDYLFIQKGFKYFSPTEIHGLLREFKCEYGRVTTESRKMVRVVYIFKEHLNVQDDYEVFTPDFSDYEDGGF